MADRKTSARGNQIANRAIKKIELDATGEVEGHVATVQADGSVDYEEAPAASSSLAVIKTLEETGHGFSVGDVVRFNGTNYIKAQADSASNANNVLGLVSTVVDENNFQLATTGYLDDLSGLVAGYTYFLSDLVAGALTATEPSAIGTVSKPMLVAVSATAGFVFNFRTSPGAVFSLVVRDINDDLTPIEEFAGQLGLFELNSDGALTPTNENINDSLLELDASDGIMPKG